MSVVLLAIEFIIVTVIGAAIGIIATGVVPLGVVIGVAAAIVVDVIAWSTAMRATIVLTRAARVTPREEKVLHDVVEAMSIANGLTKPMVYVVDDAAPNAFAFGRSAGNAGIGVTSGLLELLSRNELEGVIAQEMAHIVNHDVGVTTLAVTTIGLIAPVTNLGGRLLSLAISREREELADMSAVAIVSPKGIRQALEKLESDRTVMHRPARATAHLWFVTPLEIGGPTRKARTNAMFDSHPPIAERIAILRKLEGLDPNQRGPVDAAIGGARVDLKELYAPKIAAIEPADTASDLAANLKAAAASPKWLSSDAVPVPAGKPAGWYHVSEQTIRYWSGAVWSSATASYNGTTWVRDPLPEAPPGIIAPE